MKTLKDFLILIGIVLIFEAPSCIFAIWALTKILPNFGIVLNLTFLQCIGIGSLISLIPIIIIGIICIQKIIGGKDQ